MSLGQWKAMWAPLSKWRRRARATILDVVEVLEIGAPAVLRDRKETMVRVDAAYPFGEREHLPYKMWLVERRLFIAALADPVVLPGADEAHACSVARDLLEQDPTAIGQAQALLDEMAPNRLARKCPACAARPGRPCDDLRIPWDDAVSSPMLVPHEARLVGHLDAGPLFASQGATP